MGSSTSLSCRSLGEDGREDHRKDNTQQVENARKNSTKNLQQDNVDDNLGEDGREDHRKDNTPQVENAQESGTKNLQQDNVDDNKHASLADDAQEDGTNNFQKDNNAALVEEAREDNSKNHKECNLNDNKTSIVVEGGHKDSADNPLKGNVNKDCIVIVEDAQEHSPRKYEEGNMNTDEKASLVRVTREDSTENDQKHNVFVSDANSVSVEDAHEDSVGNQHRDDANNDHGESDLQIVEKCWQEIEKNKLLTNQRNIQTSSCPIGWPCVRVFVSSTFSDYHSEREVLVKKVFPELREWCEQRRLQFIDCDLRWGVPKDSTTEEVLLTCLEEIDRCREETNGCPFFINMLGERYGWVPTEDQVSDYIKKKYDWVFPTSITHMEIVQAAYRRSNPNAVFFVRQSDFIQSLPEQYQSQFVDYCPLSKLQLQALKNHLTKDMPNQVFHYTCQFGNISSFGEYEKVQLIDLDYFAQTVLAFLKNAIEKQFPNVTNPVSQVEIDNATHEVFMQNRGRSVLGRDNEIQEIIAYATGEKDQAKDSNSNYSPLLITAASGMGKSALISASILALKTMKLNPFYHFVGATPTSTNTHQMIMRACLFITQHYRVESDISDEDAKNLSAINTSDLFKLFQSCVENIGKNSARPVVLLFDAVNQLGDFSLSWLPRTMPYNVKIIFSAIENSREMNALAEHPIQPRRLSVTSLNSNARKEIVVNVLAQYGKSLDPTQLDLLISSKAACNPLWLALSCEELRIFGVFEEVTNKIKSFRDNLDDLLQEIVARLVGEDRSGLVKKTLCLLEISTHGLYEVELRHLLGENEPLYMLAWSQTYLTLKPFLRNCHGREGVALLDFFHRSISKTVRMKFFQDNKIALNTYRQMLIHYLEESCSDDDRVCQELPYQLLQTEEKGKLLNFMRSKRSLRMPGYLKQNYRRKFRCSMTCFKKDKPVNMCHMCSVRSDGFGLIGTPNRDTCIVCGGFAFSQQETSGHYCTRHEQHCAPQWFKCIFCQKMTPLSNISNVKPVRAKLCTFCYGTGSRCVAVGQ